MAATIVYSNNTFHFKSHTTPSSNSHALEIFVSGTSAAAFRPGQEESSRQRFGPGRKKVHGSVSARAGRKFTAAVRPGQEESSRQRFGPGRKKVHGSGFIDSQWGDDHGATAWSRDGHGDTRKRIGQRESAGKRSARIKTSFVYLFFFYHVQFPSRLLVSSPFWGTVSILTSHIVPSSDATKSVLLLLTTIVNVLVFSKPRPVPQYVLSFKGYFICLTLRGSYILLL